MHAPDLLFSWPLLIASTVLLGAGLVTWFGLNRRLVLRAWPSPTAHLAPLYIGLAGILTTLSPFAPAWVGMVLLTLALPVFAVGVLAVVWLPGFLQPRWLRNATPWQDAL